MSEGRLPGCSTATKVRSLHGYGYPCRVFSNLTSPLWKQSSRLPSTASQRYGEFHDHEALAQTSQGSQSQACCNLGRAVHCQTAQQKGHSRRGRARSMQGHREPRGTDGAAATGQFAVRLNIPPVLSYSLTLHWTDTVSQESTISSAGISCSMRRQYTIR